MITFHTAIHDRLIALLSYAFPSYIVVGPFREPPHGRIDLAELDGRAGVVCNCSLEFLSKVSIVQKDIRVMEPSIEVPLDRFDGLYNAFQLLVSCKYHKCCIFSRVLVFGLGKAAGDEDFVVLFADPPVGIKVSKLPTAENHESRVPDSYRMEGGAPAGTMNLPGPDGCRTNIMRISIMTSKGNSSTTPRGIDILEFPFNRILRWKKSSLGAIRSCCFDRVSNPGTFSRLSADGSLLLNCSRTPIF